MPASKQATRRKAAKLREEDRFEFRPFAVRSETIDLENRTVETIIATEAPVMMPDYDRWEMVPEVLLSSGVVYPPSRQVPFLDSHNRDSTEDQLGSTRQIRVEENEVRGVLHFSSTAEKQWTQVREGHSTDVSAGYQVLQKTFVPRNTKQKIQGREYTGPVNVVTKWKLREVSLTPIGADEQAKLRGLNPTALDNAGDFEMNPELRKLLESRGMPQDLDDNEAQRWAVENNFGEKKPEKKEGERTDPPATIPFDPAKFTELAAEAARKAIADEHARNAAFRSEVSALCDLADLPDLVDRCMAEGSIDKVRDLILKEKKERTDSNSVFPSVKITREGRNDLVRDIGTALSLRSMESVVPDPDLPSSIPVDRERTEKNMERIFPAANRGRGAQTFQHATLFQMAEEYVRSGMGYDTRGWTRDQVAICAMFGPDVAGVQVRDGGAYHTTGSFTNLTKDAVNKSMSLGYAEAPSTWEGPMRRGEDAADFKDLHRIRMGAIPNLPVWNDNKDPDKASFADAEEKYAVESRSLGIDFSYRLIVNDDMSALGRVPGMMGQAARRTVNSVAWAQITSNPTLGDGVALFAAATGARKRTNLTTGAGAPSVTTVQTLTNLMMQMRGENTPEGNESEDVLALMPRYIIGPSALRTTILQLVLSIADPATGVATNTYNPTNNLIPVIEPLLDASSTTAWYLFAPTTQIDTVEMTFLQGQRSPIVRQSLNFKTRSQEMYILQTFAAKALNHRGVQKHAGA